jgi:hypothetical protein
LEGAIAQMGERVNGIHEVGGSIPPGSTKLLIAGEKFSPNIFCWLLARMPCRHSVPVNLKKIVWSQRERRRSSV